MPDSPAFDYVSQALSEKTALEAIEARGTMRIVLKAAGLAAANVTPEQLEVVLERLVPGELEKRGISDATEICERIKDAVVAMDWEGPSEQSPESVFQRLSGGR